MASHDGNNISSSAEFSRSVDAKGTNVSSVSLAFKRTRQFTLEKFGKGDVTEYGPEYSQAAR